MRAQGAPKEAKPLAAAWRRQRFFLCSGQQVEASVGEAPRVAEAAWERFRGTRWRVLARARFAAAAPRAK
eukprot:12408555-Alexandrium_andersonii.AAC.1